MQTTFCRRFGKCVWACLVSKQVARIDCNFFDRFTFINLLVNVVQLQAPKLHVARGSIQEKYSNTKFVEKRIRLHLSY